MNKFLQAIISIFKKSYDSLPEHTSRQTPTVKPSTSPNSVKDPQVNSDIEEPKIKESTETKANAETAIQAELKIPAVQVSKITTDNLPQDSIQRRHAFSQLQNIIESLKGTRPTDSIQRRHYDSLINNIVKQALTDKGALEYLYKSYESLPKKVDQETIVQTQELPVTETTPIKTPSESIISLPPTDSILRRHYDTLINTQHFNEESVESQAVYIQPNDIEDIFSTPPTDSILRRHYDTLINNELNRLLEEK